MHANRNVPIGTVHVDVGGLLEVGALAARRDVAVYIEDELAVFECERLIVVDALCKRDEGAYVTDGVWGAPGCRPESRSEPSNRSSTSRWIG